MPWKSNNPNLAGLVSWNESGKLYESGKLHEYNRNKLNEPDNKGQNVMSKHLYKSTGKFIAKYKDGATVGDYLRENWLEPLRLTHYRLAKSVGIPQNRITDIVNGKRGISADTDLRLCVYFELPDGHFLGIQDKMESEATRKRIANNLNKIIPYSMENGTLITKSRHLSE
jgi:addiction module HigA family antidote